MYLKILENIGDKYENDHLKVFYVDLKKNKYFFESFKDVDTTKTQVIIIKGKRKKYVDLNKDEFSENINNVIDNIISGGGNFKRMINELNLGEKRSSDL